MAFVVDPVRKTEGVFEWRNGKPELMSHYWIGDSILTKAASGTDKSAATRPAREGAASDGAAMASGGHASYPPARESSLTTITTVLAWFCLFLLGYLLAGQSTSWERTRLQEGAVAHYGLWNLLKPGWEDELNGARADLDNIVVELKTLSDAHVSLSGEDKKELRKQWLDIRKKVASSQRTLSLVQSKYGLSDEEKQIVAVVMSQRIAEMSGVRDPALPAIDPYLPPVSPRLLDGGSSNRSSPKPSPLKPATSAEGEFKKPVRSAAKTCQREASRS